MTVYLAAAKRGDWDTAFEYFADDIVFHIPGRSSFAGDHQGKDAAREYIQAIREHHRNGKIEVELIDMLTSEDRVALLVRERFHGDADPVEIRRANVLGELGLGPPRVQRIGALPGREAQIPVRLAEVACQACGPGAGHRAGPAGEPVQASTKASPSPSLTIQAPFE